MGFAFLEQYYFSEDPGLKRCPKCKGARGSIWVQFSLNVNGPQSLRSPVCPKCERRWCEKNYPPILWKPDFPLLSPKKAARKKA